MATSSSSNSDKIKRKSRTVLISTPRRSTLSTTEHFALLTRDLSTHHSVAKDILRTLTQCHASRMADAITIAFTLEVFGDTQASHTLLINPSDMMELRSGSITQNMAKRY